MLKYALTFIVCIVSPIVSNTVLADNEQILQKYINSQFANKIEVSDQQIAQLSWIIGHTRQTNDMDRHTVKQTPHIEVVRALTRLYCLKLLRDGTKDAYDQFVAAQTSLTPAQVLSFASFKKLCKYVQNLHADDYELLQAATILSAVSLSDLAFDKVQHVQNITECQHSNLDFLATTVRLDSTVYPLLLPFTKDQQATVKLLYILFPPQTNFRHMLYTEGGAGMFKNLRTMIQHQYINKSEIDMWYAYWIVNIAGFRGHVAQDGSLYLTEPVFQAMHKLKTLIDNMLVAPNYNPLVAYLEYRAQLLGLNHLPKDQSLVLAHLGAMLRLYTVADGQNLYAGFNSLPKEQQNSFSKNYIHNISDYASPTVTHLPALFANAKNLLHGDTQRTISLVVPIYNRVRILAPDKVVSFNVLSASVNISKIIDVGLEASLSKLYINDAGDVLLNL